MSIQPDENVLSTLESDGSRRWLKPRLSKEKFLTRRRTLAWILIAVFTVIPFVKIGGKPLVLLDVAARRFTVLGFTFLPTDTVLLAIFLIGVLLFVVLFSALFGRIWCGWACPQTVYMEFVFRPIERFFEGTTGRGGKPKDVAPWKGFAKYACYLLVCLYLANTFLAYFVGIDELKQWVFRSPLEHPAPFLVMGVVTVAMMLDFCWFREQMCTLACPYGRLQSVMLDENSLIVAYDRERGDPRGKKRKKSDSALPVLGDCVDCGNCVTTCPTGIDIRNGLQMECVNCTQCIDACNLVMKKVGRAPNLIRYSSQARDAGKKGGLLRVRTIVYPLLLLGVVTAFLLTLMGKSSFQALMLREPGTTFTVTEDGMVRNVFQLKVTNRTDKMIALSPQIISPDTAKLMVQEARLEVQPGAAKTFHVSIDEDRSNFSNGRIPLKITFSDEGRNSRTLDVRLMGPR